MVMGEQGRTARGFRTMIQNNDMGWKATVKLITCAAKSFMQSGLGGKQAYLWFFSEVSAKTFEDCRPWMRCPRLMTRQGQRGPSGPVSVGCKSALTPEECCKCGLHTQ